jgi:hypothetical protein
MIEGTRNEGSAVTVFCAALRIQTGGIFLSRPKVLNNPLAKKRQRPIISGSLALF